MQYDFGHLTYPVGQDAFSKRESPIHLFQLHGVQIQKSQLDTDVSAFNIDASLGKSKSHFIKIH